MIRTSVVKKKRFFEISKASLSRQKFDIPSKQRKFYLKYFFWLEDNCVDGLRRIVRYLIFYVILLPCLFYYNRNFIIILLIFGNYVNIFLINFVSSHYQFYSFVKITIIRKDFFISEDNLNATIEDFTKITNSLLLMDCVVTECDLRLKIWQLFLHRVNSWKMWKRYII